MSRDRSNELWKHMRFSNKPETIPENMSSEKYQWMLVDDFTYAFNEHRGYVYVLTKALVYGMDKEVPGLILDFLYYGGRSKFSIIPIAL
jgi:hypothetical protein